MKKTTAAAALFLALSSLMVSAAHADVIYYFDKTGYYNGNTPITDTANFASATFTTIAGGGVTLKMTVLAGLDYHAYVNDWAFNIDSAIKNLNIVSAAAPAASKGIDFGDNSVKNFGGNNGGAFDLAFHFGPADPGQIQIGATSIYTLTSTNLTLTENSFKAANEKGFYSAVKVQGYGNGLSSEYHSGGPTDKAVTPASVPEPGTVALLGLGFFGLLAFSRRFKKA